MPTNKKLHAMFEYEGGCAYLHEEGWLNDGVFDDTKTEKLVELYVAKAKELESITDQIHDHIDSLKLPAPVEEDCW